MGLLFSLLTAIWRCRWSANFVLQIFCEVRPELHGQPFSRFLRAPNLDELPVLTHVLKGGK